MDTRKYINALAVLLVSVGLGGIATLEAEAATRTVTTAADTVNSGDGVLSLREAIATAQAGDTIKFATGLSGKTITLHLGQLTISKNLTITGLGASRLTVHGNFASRVLVITGGAKVRISGLTIAGGNTEDEYWEGTGDGTGGGLRNSGTLTVTDSTIKGNSAIFGGGISNSGRMQLIRSQVSGNSAGNGTDGGILNTGTLSLSHSTVSNNDAEESGGIGNYGHLTLTDSTVSDNSAAELGSGGGIYNGSGSVTEITRSTISNNYADVAGGGICNHGTLSLLNSTVSGNRVGFVDFIPSSGTGGGISNSGTLSLSNSTISNNHASDNPQGSGGGISRSGGTVRFDQTIVAGNTAGGSNHTAVSDCAGTFTSLGYNLVGAGTGCAHNGPGDRAVTPAIVFTKVLGPLQDNGGPTQTHALRAGSPASDAGGTQCPTTDQRGVSRPSGGACDIGAVEFIVATSTTAWQNFPFAPQTGLFTAEFEAVPQQNHMNGVTGLAFGPVSGNPNETGVIVRFYSSGYIDAFNGTAYTAATKVPYTAGTRYFFRLVVDVHNHTYSVYVRPAGGTEQLLGANYAFRTEQQTVPQLDTLALKAWTGSHTVSNFAVK